MNNLYICSLDAETCLSDNEFIYAHLFDQHPDTFRSTDDMLFGANTVNHTTRYVLINAAGNALESMLLLKCKLCIHIEQRHLTPPLREKAYLKWGANA